MKLHNGGLYKTEDDLKGNMQHHEGAVAFREPDLTMLAIVANAGSIAVFIILCVISYFIAGIPLHAFAPRVAIASVISLITLIPHEFLHAVCFKEDVYMYYVPSKLLLFVHGTESMSKLRFVFMSMLPNIVLGIIPYVLFLLNHNWLLPGMIGALCFSMGFGDYINVFNALTQMPKGAKTYLYGSHSYWYM